MSMNRVLLFLFTALALAACSPEVQRVYGRYVPERKDDFAWENEYAAFRMYGPALKGENPSNGVDLWLKNSPALVVDTMYGRELKDHRPYHINYDGNLDCYKVGHTAGCGGLVVWAEGDSALSVGGPYDRWEILEQTATRLVFRLEYDSLPVCGQLLTEQITITVEAGQLFNKAEVVLMCPTKIRLPQLYAGGAIYLHDSLDNVVYDKEHSAIIYAEDALSDKQAAQMNLDYNGSTTQGRAYLAVSTPGATVLQEQDGCLVALRPVELGEPFTYYFGACWSEWTDGKRTLKSDADWQQLVTEFLAK